MKILLAQKMFKDLKIAIYVMLGIGFMYFVGNGLIEIFGLFKEIFN